MILGFVDKGMYISEEEKSSIQMEETNLGTVHLSLYLKNSAIVKW